MRYIVQAVVALAALLGLPVFLDAPTSLEGLSGAAVGALILIVIAVWSIVAYVRSRKPQSYHDSVMPPRK